jgi:hypothetical protein
MDGLPLELQVNERTVYRYFGSERGLRDAVMHRNEQEAGIDLAGMQVEDVATVAAMLDVLWSVASYERLVVDWQIDHERASQGLTWVIGLVAEAVRDGRGPDSAPEN